MTRFKVLFIIAVFVLIGLVPQNSYGKLVEIYDSSGSHKTCSTNKECSITTNAFYEYCMNNKCYYSDQVGCYKNADCNDHDDLTEDRCICPGYDIGSTDMSCKTNGYCSTISIECKSNSDCKNGGLCKDGGTTLARCVKESKKPGSCKKDTDCEYKDKSKAGFCMNDYCLYKDIACWTDMDCYKQSGDQSKIPSCKYKGTPDSYCSYKTWTCTNDVDCSYFYFQGKKVNIPAGHHMKRKCINNSCANYSGGCNEAAICDDGVSKTTDICKHGQCINAECFNHSDCWSQQMCENPGTNSAECTPIECRSTPDCGDRGVKCINPMTKKSKCVECDKDTDCPSSSKMLGVCVDKGTVAAMCSKTKVACVNDKDCDDKNSDSTDYCQFQGSAKAKCVYSWKQKTLASKGEHILDGKDKKEPARWTNCDPKDTTDGLCCEKEISDGKDCREAREALPSKPKCTTNSQCVSLAKDKKLGVCRNPGKYNAQCDTVKVECMTDEHCKKTSKDVNTYYCQDKGTEKATCMYILDIVNLATKCDKRSDCSENEGCSMGKCLPCNPNNTEDAVCCRGESNESDVCMIEAEKRQKAREVQGEQVSKTVEPGKACRDDKQCDDGIESTTDKCKIPAGQQTGVCVHKEKSTASSSSSGTGSKKSKAVEKDDGVIIVEPCSLDSDCKNSVDGSSGVCMKEEGNASGYCKYKKTRIVAVTSTTGDPVGEQQIDKSKTESGNIKRTKDVDAPDKSSSASTGGSGTKSMAGAGLGGAQGEMGISGAGTSEGSAMMSNVQCKKDEDCKSDDHYTMTICDAGTCKYEDQEGNRTKSNNGTITIKEEKKKQGTVPVRTMQGAGSEAGIGESTMDESKTGSSDIKKTKKVDAASEGDSSQVLNGTATSSIAGTGKEKAAGSLKTATGVSDAKINGVSCKTDEDCHDKNPLTTDRCYSINEKGIGFCEHSKVECNVNSQCYDDDPTTQDSCVEGTCYNIKYLTNKCTIAADCPTTNDPWKFMVCSTSNECVEMKHNCLTHSDCKGDGISYGHCDTLTSTINTCVITTERCMQDTDCNDSNHLTSDVCQGSVCRHKRLFECAYHYDCKQDDNPDTIAFCEEGKCVVSAYNSGQTVPSKDGTITPGGGKSKTTIPEILDAASSLSNPSEGAQIDESKTGSGDIEKKEESEPTIRKPAAGAASGEPASNVTTGRKDVSMEDDGHGGGKGKTVDGTGVTLDGKGRVQEMDTKSSGYDPAPDPFPRTKTGEKAAVELDGKGESGADEMKAPPTAFSCKDDIDCEDNNEQTVDFCLPTGECVNDPCNPGVMDDEICCDNEDVANSSDCRGKSGETGGPGGPQKDCSSSEDCDPGTGCKDNMCVPCNPDDDMDDVCCKTEKKRQPHSRACGGSGVESPSDKEKEEAAVDKDKDTGGSDADKDADKEQPKAPDMKQDESIVGGKETTPPNDTFEEKPFGEPEQQEEPKQEEPPVEEQKKTCSDSAECDPGSGCNTNGECEPCNPEDDMDSICCQGEKEIAPHSIACGGSGEPSPGEEPGQESGGPDYDEPGDPEGAQGDEGCMDSAMCAPEHYCDPFEKSCKPCEPGVEDPACGMPGGPDEGAPDEEGPGSGCMDSNECGPGMGCDNGSCMPCDPGIPDDMICCFEEKELNQESSDCNF